MVRPEEVVAIVILLILLFGAVAVYIMSQQSDASSNSPAAPIAGNWNAQQIALIANQAGFTGDDLATAVAIALAESSGNPNAYNPETAAHTPSGLGSYGLWQIYLKMHPEYTAAQLLDPATNAQAAFAIYQQRGGQFTAWSTFTAGAYNKYLAQATAAANLAEGTDQGVTA